MNTRIGWIGLGRMGILMSQRLLKQGFPLTVFNRTKGKEAALLSLGASAASSPSQVMALSDIVILMVSDDQATRDMFSGEDGLLNSEQSGKVIINMSTVSADVSKEMAELCRKNNNHYLDAPVSGSVKQAESGELVIMVGGEESIFNQVKPILNIMGKLSILAGETGKGNITKLAVNALLGILTQGLSESIVYAKKNGIKTEDLLTVINNGAMSNPYVKIKGDLILHDKFEPAFALKHIVKDLRLAKESGLNTPLGEAAYKTFKEAETKFAEEDLISIIKFIS